MRTARRPLRRDGRPGIGERRNQEAVERSLHNLKELVEAIKDYSRP